MALRHPRKPILLLRTIVFVAAFAQPLAARAADSLLMFVLGFGKNLVESSMQDEKARRGKAWGSNVASAPVPAALQSPKTPASMNQEDLRALIDESFVYLSRSQLAELHAGLDKALADPANSAQREAILNQFVAVARQVQFIHGQLNHLSPDDKRLLVARYAANFRTLSPDQQQALLEQLRQHELPLPTDLNDMMLAALTPMQQ